MKQLRKTLLLCAAFFSAGLYAQESVTAGEQDMAPVTTFSRDTLMVNEDSVLIVITVCAPVCSSIVIVEDAQGGEKGEIPSPYPNAVFPEAYIENQRLMWRDNTYLLLDEDEKRWKEATDK